MSSVLLFSPPVLRPCLQASHPEQHQHLQVLPEHGHGGAERPVQQAVRALQVLAVPQDEDRVEVQRVPCPVSDPGGTGLFLRKGGGRSAQERLGSGVEKGPSARIVSNRSTSTRSLHTDASLPKWRGGWAPRLCPGTGARPLRTDALSGPGAVDEPERVAGSCAPVGTRSRGCCGRPRLSVPTSFRS